MRADKEIYMTAGISYLLSQYWVKTQASKTLQEQGGIKNDRQPTSKTLPLYKLAGIISGNIHFLIPFPEPPSADN